MFRVSLTEYFEMDERELEFRYEAWRRTFEATVAGMVRGSLMISPGVVGGEVGMCEPGWGGEGEEEEEGEGRWAGQEGVTGYERRRALGDVSRGMYRSAGGGR